MRAVVVLLASKDALLAWTCRCVDAGREDFVLRVRSHDRARVVRPYVHLCSKYVESVADEIELRWSVT